MVARKKTQSISAPLALALLSLAPASTRGDTNNRTIAPASTLFSGLDFTAPATKYPGTGTDMHWWTWGADGNIYTVDDDGKNFGEPWNFAHLMQVTGLPPNHEVKEISRFPGLIRHGHDRVRYVSGALAVGQRLYVAAYDYDYSFPGKDRWKVDSAHKLRPTVEDTTTKQLDAVSELAGVAALMYSDNLGRTWKNIPGKNTPYFLGPKFAGLAFVGFGPGYTGVPTDLGDYVYAISNDDSWETGSHVFLARAPKKTLLNRKTWEFYAGVGGDPAWIRDEHRARSVHSDHGHVGHPTMTYNAALGRFLLAYSSDVVPHSMATPPQIAEATWHRARELVLLEGPTPWGPWGLVHHESFWEGDHVAYLPQLPGKWFSADGMAGTLLFSGDYKQFGKHTPKEQSFYGFMTRPFKLRRK